MCLILFLQPYYPKDNNMYNYFSSQLDYSRINYLMFNEGSIHFNRYDLHRVINLNSDYHTINILPLILMSPALL